MQDFVSFYPLSTKASIPYQHMPEGVWNRTLSASMIAICDLRDLAYREDLLPLRYGGLPEDAPITSRPYLIAISSLNVLLKLRLSACTLEQGVYVSKCTFNDPQA
jgi:hypothetical protein